MRNDDTNTFFDPTVTPKRAADRPSAVRLAPCTNLRCKALNPYPADKPAPARCPRCDSPVIGPYTRRPIADGEGWTS